MKRSHADEEEAGASSSKRANVATASQSPKHANTPSSIEGFHLTKVLGLSAKYNSRALSMSDILHAVRPTSSIHFNFMIDLEWLLQ